jgi:hypothetical protein
MRADPDAQIALLLQRQNGADISDDACEHALTPC